jgi:uncharacterized protein YecT (DUF1311 family)
MKLFAFWAMLFLFSACASAQERYLMIGAARFEKSADPHALPFPVNPANSGALTFDGGAFTFHYAGDSCSVKVERRMDFYLDPAISHTFGSREGFSRFLSDKFHSNYQDSSDTYLLGETNVPLCAGLREAIVYKSPDGLVLLGGSWAYAFQRQTHAPSNAEKNFDCAKAQTNVEHLICGNPELVRLDAAVNRGFVAMQLVDSSEISYQDPVKINQINWIRNVRNKCTSSSCLFDAYHSRVEYINSKISSAYPSYPAEESEQDGD